MPILHHDGLLQDIIDHPDDNGLRHIYADWFEDTSDPSFVAYAEYIRRECSEPGSPRAAEMHAYHVRKWNGLVHRQLIGSPFQHRVHARRALIRGWRYRRGFIADLTASDEAVITDAGAVFRIGPLERVNVLCRDEPLGRLLTALTPFRLRELELRVGVLNAPEVDALLAAQSWLSNLESLRVNVRYAPPPEITRLHQAFAKQVPLTFLQAGALYQGAT
jgi:uncharacterized protein (TIGR02996 family)